MTRSHRNLTPVLSISCHYKAVAVLMPYTTRHAGQIQEFECPTAKCLCAYFSVNLTRLRVPDKRAIAIPLVANALGYI